MKYKVITTKTLYGEIIVTAKDKDTAEIKARDIAQYDNYNWVNEHKVSVHEIHEIPFTCVKCGAKLPIESKYCNICGEKCEYSEVDLGRVYTELFDKQCQTTSLLYEFFNGFDTILLKYVFSIYKEETALKTIFANVSFYIKRYPIHLSTNVIESYMNMSDIKNKYCGEQIYANLSKSHHKYSVLYSEIASSFAENKYDANGDYFFDKSIRFRAKADKFGEKGGRGSDFYIVGVNFKIQ